MRAQPQGIVFLAFGTGPHVEKIFREHIALEKKIVVWSLS